MSYYSEIQYKKKQNLWFENFYFNRWFKNNSGPILDIGCNTGNFIATHPEIISGIDNDEDALKICRERGFNAQKIDVERDLGQLPSNFYTGVYAKQVIEHLEDASNFVKHIRRILKPGGKAVILTPNCPYALNRFFWDDYTHKRPLTKISLRNLAFDAGFSKIEIYTDFRCFPGLGRLIRTFHFTPEFIARVQRILFIQGLSLIMELEK